MIYEQHNIKIHSIIFTICILLFLLSPPYNQGIAGEKEAKTTSGSVATGMVSTVSNTGENNNKKGLSFQGGQISTKEMETNGMEKKGLCNIECKIAKLIEIGIREEIAISLVDNCKKQDIAVVNCIKLGASIVVSESGGGKRCNKNGCFGILGGIKYTTVEEGVEDWVKRFGKYWLNQKTPNSFYSNSPDWTPKTRYCMSERQPDGSVLPYCKNGHKHAWSVFNRLDF